MRAPCGAVEIGSALGTALALWLATALASPAMAAIEIAVTVDDLPAHGPLPPGGTRLAIAAQMIQALTRHDVPAVYGFANGGQLVESPELEAILRAWLRAGFPLGNHTLSHLDLTRVGVPEYVADIERNEEILVRLSPPGAPRYFRYPYLHEGDTRDKRRAIREWLAARGYALAPVTISLDDWTWNDVHARCAALGDEPAIARLKILFMEMARSRLAKFADLSQRVFKQPIKHILMVHMGAFSALVLDDLLTAYRAAGAKFISLPEALRDPLYRIDRGWVQDDGQTFLVRVARARQVPVPAALSGSPDALDSLCR